MQTKLTKALGIEHPIIQAPMGGANATPPALVSAVSKAGGLGFIGAAYMTPDEIASNAREIRSRTARPFGINLFAPVSVGPPPDSSLALARLTPFHDALGLPAPRFTPPTLRFDDQLDAALETGAAAFSFTFGLLSASAATAVKARGMYLIGTATTVDEAIALERSGVDAIVAQGSEAGAHRGTFATDFEKAMIGTIALVPQVVDAVDVPVIASGGIMDGRGAVAALALGASAVQLGTVFLVADECGIAEAYKAAVLDAHEDATRVTRAFSGRPARGIVNRFMAEAEAGDSSAILPYPYQNALTRPMRTAAASQGRAEFLSLWAGQGVRLARRRPASAIVQSIATEMSTIIERLDASRGGQQRT